MFDVLRLPHLWWHFFFTTWTGATGGWEYDEDRFYCSKCDLVYSVIRVDHGAPVVNARRRKS